MLQIKVQSMTLSCVCGKRDKSLMAPTENVAVAFYLSSTSAKLQYLARIVTEVCVLKGKSLLVFFEWVMPLWETTAFLDSLGLCWRVIHIIELKLPRRDRV
jgi:hypothetical protein